jgi:hypothetical protein
VRAPTDVPSLLAYCKARAAEAGKRADTAAVQADSSFARGEQTGWECAAIHVEGILREQGRRASCEWNPAADRPALDTDPSHGPAVVSLRGYDGGIHLCAACATLPRFRRFKARPLPTPRS